MKDIEDTRLFREQIRHPKVLAEAGSGSIIKGKGILD